MGGGEFKAFLQLAKFTLGHPGKFSISTENSVKVPKDVNNDESFFTLFEQSSYFECQSGEIISLLGLCNGVDDCLDRSDELECTNTTGKFITPLLDISNVFVLRFCDPVNPLGSCHTRSIYLTTLFPDRLSSLSV